MPSMSAQSDPVSFSAKYYDGRKAVAHQVHVQLSATALMIISENGSVLESWPFHDIELGDRAKDWVRIAKKDSEARLAFSNPAAFRALKDRAPGMLDQQKKVRHGMVLAVASTIAVIAGIYFSTPLLTQAIVAMVPYSFETKLGNNAADAIVNVVGVNDKRSICKSREGYFALDEMVQKLSKHTSGSYAYNVRVLDVDMVNAIALPGGNIFLFRGLLEKAETPEEVAGVLAHEMAHVDFRHPMHGMVRSYGLQIISDMMFGGGSLSGISSILMSTSYTREAEAEADDAALQTMHSAGISTDGFAAFFARLHQLEQKNSFGLPDFLATHPASDERAQKARDVRVVPNTKPVLTTEHWKALHAICDE
ncbi:MAG: M48 family metallopeptidase [Magnetovibrio sp.]|nr:M48 family metallopeptidase [Magnetovibrio sp.]